MVSPLTPISTTYRFDLMGEEYRVVIEKAYSIGPKGRDYQVTVWQGATPFDYRPKYRGGNNEKSAGYLLEQALRDKAN